MEVVGGGGAEGKKREKLLAQVKGAEDQLSAPVLFGVFMQWLPFGSKENIVIASCCFLPLATIITEGTAQQCFLGWMPIFFFVLVLFAKK